MSEKMTIHRALAELKLIDSKIERKCRHITASGGKQKDGLVNEHHKEEEFVRDVKALFQSVTDLIQRKQSIKSAIVVSNATTQVKIGENTMTVAEAIHYKEIVNAKQLLIDNLRTKHSATLTGIEQANAKVDQNALKLAEAALGKDNVKITDTDALSITGPYLEKYRFTLVDPLKV